MTVNYRLPWYQQINRRDTGHVSFCKIRDGGARALAAALRRNTTLRKLDLDGNEMGNDGRLSLAEAMRLNTTVRKLDIIGILPGQSL